VRRSCGCFVRSRIVQPYVSKSKRIGRCIDSAASGHCKRFSPRPTPDCRGARSKGQQIVSQIAPEAPRTIFDALATLDKLPLGLHGRGEYEYVGHKQLDMGNAQHPSTYEAIPVGETRLAVVRTFLNGRLEMGANGMLARGYTGQTTETFAPAWQLGAIPYCAPGSQAVVPLHPVLAGHMTSWHNATPYARPGDWVFPSFKLLGRKPRVADMLVEDHLRPAAVASGVIKKRDKVRWGFHNLRHSLASFLVQAGRDPTPCRRCSDTRI
jgi:hypothetical protein